MRFIRFILRALLGALASRTAFEAAVLVLGFVFASAAAVAAGVTAGPHVQAAAMLALPTTVITILSAIAVIVVPIVAVPINKVILNLNTTIDALPAWIKQIVVGLVTTLLTLAAQHLPGVPTSLQGFDVTTIAALLNTGITFLLHYVQSQPAASSTSLSAPVASKSVPATPIAPSK